MKKILFLLFAVLLPAMAEAYDARIDGIYYSFNKDAKTATVTYYRDGSGNQNAYSGTVNIPATVNYSGETYDVTGIGAGAFFYCSGLITVTIPNSVTSIGNYAFSETGWYNNQPNGILYLDNWLLGYKGEKPIGQLDITEGTKGIAVGAFIECSGLTSVAIPNSVTSIGASAFCYCSGLTSVMIPNSVTSIGSYAFAGCSSLTSVTIPNNVTSIGESAFNGCSSLTSVTIPNSVTSIGESAFNGCSSLTSVTIPNSVTSIGEEAFRYCSGLTSVTIPNSVTSIGSYAFWDCNRINTLYISDLSAWCKLHTLSSFSPIISSNHHLYLNGVEVERMTIPNNITSLGNYTFYGCSYITSIIIPNSVATIGESAFQNCSKVEELRLPSNLQIIKKATFKGCNSLKTVSIPSTVEVIYQEAFSDNYYMESVKALPETPPFLYDNSFSNYNIPLYASKTAIGAYQAKEPWSKFAQFLTLDGQEVEVPQCATPTIDYANWKLTFNCATKGAEIVSKAKVLEEKEGGSELSLTPTYTITAYAKAEGYRDSEVATATIGWKNGRPVIIQGFSNVSLSDYDPNCDTNLDGAVNVADIATIIDAMAAQAREQKDLGE